MPAGQTVTRVRGTCRTDSKTGEGEGARVALWPDSRDGYTTAARVRTSRSVGALPHVDMGGVGGAGRDGVESVGAGRGGAGGGGVR